MTAAAITVSADELCALVARMFTACGLPRTRHHAWPPGLVEADLEGMASHGVMLVDMYIERIRRGSVSTESEADGCFGSRRAVVLDAGHALGQSDRRAGDGLAVERARKLRRRHRRGAPRLSFRDRAPLRDPGCRSRLHRHRDVQHAAVDAGAGGAERLVGNNPIAIALPAPAPIPIVLDMATSEAAMGKIRHGREGRASRSRPTGRPTPTAAPTTEPAEAIAGMLLPSGGPKGFGLAFVIDLMCGLLVRRRQRQRGSAALRRPCGAV